MTRSVAIAAMAMCLIAAKVSAKELWERKWIEVETTHFRIVSALSEARSLILADELEEFRKSVEIITNIGRFDDRVPTFVYVLPHRVKALGFTNDILGWFDAEMRANYAVVTPSQHVPLDDVLKHEYVHFLLHNRDERNYPTWFDEGFAELLATVTVREDAIEYGYPPKDRVLSLQQLPWIPFDRLLEANGVWDMTPIQRSAFYAQAWLLVHFLMNSERVRWQAASAEFLDSIEEGVKPADAFEQAFGVRVDTLKTKLLRYLADLRFMRMRLTQPLSIDPPTTTNVSTESIAAQLGTLYLQRGSNDQAKAAWEAALAANPNNTTALVGLGDILKFANKFEEARPYYEKAIALEPKNAHAELDFAEYFVDVARAKQEEVARASDLAEARRHFARSFRLDPAIPETLAMNGESYLVDASDYKKAVDSLALAHQMLPSNATIRYMLAKAYAGQGDSATAIGLLRSVIAWGHASNVEEARKLLDDLTKGAATASSQSAQ